MHAKILEIKLILIYKCAYFSRVEERTASSKTFKVFLKTKVECLKVLKNSQWLLTVCKKCCSRINDSFYFIRVLWKVIYQCSCFWSCTIPPCFYVRLSIFATGLYSNWLFWKNVFITEILDVNVLNIKRRTIPLSTIYTQPPSMYLISNHLLRRKIINFV